MFVQLGNQAPADSNQVDTSETVYISSLALLKMLKHGRAGVPMEVDYFTVQIICHLANYLGNGTYAWRIYR